MVPYRISVKTVRVVRTTDEFGMEKKNNNRNRYHRSVRTTVMIHVITKKNNLLEVSNNDNCVRILYTRVRDSDQNQS